MRSGSMVVAARESDAHPAWKRAIVDARAEESVASMAFNAGMPVPGPHRVPRRSIEAAEALDGEDAGVVRMGGVEIAVARFAPLPPTRESTAAIEAMPFYAGQSAGAVTAIRPAAEIVRELAAGVPVGP